MGHKCIFQPLTRIVQITLAPDASGEVDFDVKADLYSDGKEDWISLQSGDLSNWKFPVEAIGGQSLPGERALGATFFLNYGWRIRPYEGTHVFNVNGNLYTPEGASPFVPTSGEYNVTIIQQVSSLVDSTFAQQEEVEYASFNGGVTVDTTNGISGTLYPTGTPQQPVNNWTDALSIASTRGLTTFFVIGDTTISGALDFGRYVFVGESQTKSEITIDVDAQVDGCEFYDATVVGTLDGDVKVQNCTIRTLAYLNGIIEQCLLETGTITLSGEAEAHFLDCWSGVSGASIPIIDMGDVGQSLSLRNYNGDIKLVNKHCPCPISIDLNSGHIELDSTVTSGEITIRGIGRLTDNSTGNVNLHSDYLINPAILADAFWDEPKAEHTGETTFGSMSGQITDISGEISNVSSEISNISGEISSMATDVARLLGLTQENYYLDQTSYDTYNGIKLLTSGRMRIYSNAGSVGTASDVLATYTITAVWSNDELQTYKVVKS
jgi:hypothetical protein